MSPTPSPDTTEAVAAAALAATGGAARLLAGSSHLQLGHFARQACSAGFAGVMVWLLLSSLPVLSAHSHLQGFLIGMAGYSSAQTLALLERAVQRWLGSHTR